MMKLRIQNLDFFYSRIHVLKNVSVSVNKGELVALVGPNGSGKSTLMKCINRILKYKSGVVEIDGIDIQNISNLDLAKKVAYVPQYESKIRGIKVFDMVLLGRKPYMSWKPSSNDYEIVSRVIETLRMEDFAMKDVFELSGGQQQLISIARAMVQEPDVFLLDEPTNNLDIKHQIKIMDVLKGLCREGKTVIVTLHDVNLAIRYANRFIMLREGKVFSQGGKETITEENLRKLYDVEMKLIYENGSCLAMPKAFFRNKIKRKLYNRIN